MSAFLESPPRSLSFADLAGFSQQLSDDIGRLTPRAGGFSVADYLQLDGNYLVEFADGRLQILPMPNALHQELAYELTNRLKAWSAPDPGARTKLAPFFVRLSERRYREPDVCFMLGIHANRRHADHWEGADLVVEVVSDSDRTHDEVTKRAEYAAAGVPEYWIVDPAARSVRVLTLSTAGAPAYSGHGEFTEGQTATSALLPGFAVDVAELFAAAERQA